MMSGNNSQLLSISKQLKGREFLTDLRTLSELLFKLQAPPGSVFTSTIASIIYTKLLSISCQIP